MPFVTAYANDAGRNEPGGVLRPFRAGGKFVVVRGYAPPGGRSPARSGAPGHALSRSWLRRGLQRARPGAALPVAGFPLRLLPRCPGLQRATRRAALGRRGYFRAALRRGQLRLRDLLRRPGDVRPRAHRRRFAGIPSRAAYRRFVGCTRGRARVVARAPFLLERRSSPLPAAGTVRALAPRRHRTE